MNDDTMKYEQFRNALDHALLDELETLRARGHLSRDGLLAIRSRLTESQEFAESPARDLLALHIEGSLGMRRAVPGDLAELDELTAFGDDSGPTGPPEPEPPR
jgi:hypothetical protein